MTLPKKLSGRLALLALLALTPVSLVRADDFTWSGPSDSGTSDWNSGGNWSQPISSFLAPVNPGDRAFFGQSDFTDISLTGTVTIRSVTFNAGADAYTIDLNSQRFDLLEGGIVNLSGATQTFVNNGEGTLSFLNAASAGNAAINNAVPFGVVFNNSATAGTATITNTSNGSANFIGASSLGQGTIANTTLQSQVLFGGTATASQGTIANSGSSASATFDQNSTADRALIVNSGTNSFTSFIGNSRGGQALIVNSGVNSDAFFAGTSSAENATIINTGVGSRLSLSGNASGGQATVINASPSSVFSIAALNSGGTTVGSIEGGGTIYLGTKTLTVGGNGKSTTFSGSILEPDLQDDISGPTTGGSLVKVGPGTLVLAGASNYSGTTTVNGGALVINGSIASLTTTINSGGMLGGRGLIGGSLFNGGMMSPGNSPGTFTVNGDYTQSSSGALRIEIAGLAPNQHDLLAVRGRATLAGALQVVSLNGFKLGQGDQVTFLTAGRGVVGTFDTVDTGTIIGGRIVYQANSVLIEGSRGAFADICPTPNGHAVGVALDRIVNDSRYERLISYLDRQQVGSLCEDFEKISPEELSAIFNIGISLGNVQLANLGRRMADIRAGSTGFSAAGFALGGDISASGLAGVAGPAGKSGKAVEPAPAAADPRFGTFITGLGEFTDISDNGNTRGFDLSTGGFTLGVDYRVCSNFAIGLTAGYANTGADLADGGRLRVNGGKLGVYATAFAGGFYIDATVTGGLSDYDSHRRGLQGTARGDSDGSEVLAATELGYDWKVGALSIGPTAGFSYHWVEVDGFREHGSLAPLKFDDQDAESTRLTLGMKASYECKVGSVILKPEVRADWQHEFTNTEYAVVSSFAQGSGGKFGVQGPRTGRDSLLIGAGASILWNDRVSSYAYYDGELLRADYQSNTVTAGIRVQF